MKIPNIPIAQPDQTIESYVTSIQLANTVSRPTLLNELFGSPIAKIRGTDFKGFINLYHSKAGSAFSSFEEFIQKHHLIFLLFEFNQEYVVETVIKKLRDNNPNRILTLLGQKLSNTFREINWFCPRCANEEFDRHGYAYAHRTHQVRGVVYCPHHGVPIGPPKDDQDYFEIDGIIVAPSNQKTSFAVQKSPLVSLNNDSIKRFGMWVEAIYTSKLPLINHHKRNLLLSKKINNSISENKNLLSLIPHVQTKLIQDYGEKYFHEFNIDINNCTNEKWINLYLIGLNNKNHTIVQILLLNMVFKTPQQYKENIHEDDLIIKGKNNQNNLCRIGLPYFSFYREVLKTRIVKDIKLKYGVTLSDLLNNRYYYGRLKPTQKAIKAKSVICTHRKVFFTQLIDSASIMTPTCALQNLPSFSWLQENDGHWLDKTMKYFHFPHSTHIDNYYSEKIKKMGSELQLSLIPLRLSKNYLYEKVFQQYPETANLNDRPYIIQAITNLQESIREYQARILKQICFLAERNERSDAVLLAYNFLCSNPNRKSLMRRVVVVLYNNDLLEQFRSEYLFREDPKNLDQEPIDGYQHTSQMCTPVHNVQ